MTPGAFDAAEQVSVLSARAQQELGRALEALAGPVAVRSSGIAEDLAGASFAGQYETVLDVEGVAAVEAAIARCVASARSERVREYRQERGIDAAPMAVLVQRMVKARAAGVAFTAHPVTGERGVTVVSAVRGLGEALVSGQADAEEWEIRAEPVRRRFVLPVLSEREAREVGDLARAVEDGVPVDIEWAIEEGEGAGRLCLLQARPMTALPDATTWEPGAPGGYVRNFRLGEWIGAPVTPLFESWILTDLEEGLHGHFERLTGLVTPRPLHVVVHGWYFYGGMRYELGAGAMLRALPRMLVALFDRRKRAMMFAGNPPLAHLGFDVELRRWRDELLPALRHTVERAEGAIDAASPAELVRVGPGDRGRDGRAADVDRRGGGVRGEGGAQAASALEGEGAHVRRLCHRPRRRSGGLSAAHDVEGLDPIFPTLGERGGLPPAPTGAQRARVLARRDEAEALALAAVPDGQRARLRALLAEARRAHAARLEQTGVFTLGWPVMRRALLRLGEALETQGVIGAAGDVFFVKRAELDRALAGERASLPIAERRATWERQRRLAPPLVVGEPTGLLKVIMGELERLNHPEHAEPDALGGMPGSAGRHRCGARRAQRRRARQAAARGDPGRARHDPSVDARVWSSERHRHRHR
ncbi:MAG: PEP/pyruvate-binding domain-containing protein [Polyangiaceae bacterium]|nr:PEP/pyruvate-binding domain-containing protein [Polyangiaceae bacterium]